jgi:hypothetical protein
MILVPIDLNAQKWVLKDYLDDFGDPSGKKHITQTVDATFYSEKLILSIDKDINSPKNFCLNFYGLNGDPMCIVDQSFIDRMKKAGGKLAFRYKTGEKESFFYIPDPVFLNPVSAKSVYGYIEVNSSELEAVLLSATLPVKCIIAVKDQDTFVNIVSFIIYPSNYKQFVQLDLENRK